MPAIDVYTVADDDYFVGLVALVRSLRVHGHHDRVTVLDLGLTDAQRAALASECRFVRLPEAETQHPWFLTPYPARCAPDGVVACLDADVIVTGSLAPIADAAASGRICAGADRLVTRHFSEWESLFGLRAAPRVQPYVNSGALVFSTRAHPELLARWWECCQRVAARDATRALDHTDPLALADQDALNALLMSEVAGADLEVVRGFVHDPFMRGVRVRDRRRLACTIDGTPTVVIHAYGAPKPWHPAARGSLRRTAYVRLLREVLRDARLDAASLVPWLRPGARGALVADAWYTRNWVLGHGRRARRRLRERQARRAGALPRPAAPACRPSAPR